MSSFRSRIIRPAVLKSSSTCTLHLSTRSLVPTNTASTPSSSCPSKNMDRLRYTHLYLLLGGGNLFLVAHPLMSCQWKYRVWLFDPWNWRVTFRAVLQEANGGNDPEEVGEYASCTTHPHRNWLSGQELNRCSTSFDYNLFLSFLPFLYFWKLYDWVIGWWCDLWGTRDCIILQ